MPENTNNTTTLDATAQAPNAGGDPVHSHTSWVTPDGETIVLNELEARNPGDDRPMWEPESPYRNHTPNASPNESRQTTNATFDPKDVEIFRAIKTNDPSNVHKALEGLSQDEIIQRLGHKHRKDGKNIFQIAVLNNHHDAVKAVMLHLSPENRFALANIPIANSDMPWRGIILSSDETNLETLEMVNRHLTPEQRMNLLSAKLYENSDLTHYLLTQPLPEFTRIMFEGLNSEQRLELLQRTTDDAGNQGAYLTTDAANLKNIEIALEKMRPEHRMQLLTQQDSILFQASAMNRPDVVDKLLGGMEPEQRFEILRNARTQQGDSLLSEQVIYGDAATTKSLIKDLSPEQIIELARQRNPNNGHQNAVDYAFNTGNIEPIKVAFKNLSEDQIFDLLTETGPHGMTPLHMAHHKKGAAAVEFALELFPSDRAKSVLMNWVDHKGFTVAEHMEYARKTDAPQPGEQPNTKKIVTSTANINDLKTVVGAGAGIITGVNRITNAENNMEVALGGLEITASGVDVASDIFRGNAHLAKRAGWIGAAVTAIDGAYETSKAYDPNATAVENIRNVGKKGSLVADQTGIAILSGGLLGPESGEILHNRVAERREEQWELASGAVKLVTGAKDRPKSSELTGIIQRSATNELNAGLNALNAAPGVTLVKDSLELGDELGENEAAFRVDISNLKHLNYAHVRFTEPLRKQGAKINDAGMLDLTDGRTRTMLRESMEQSIRDMGFSKYNLFSENRSEYKLMTSALAELTKLEWYPEQFRHLAFVKPKEEPIVAKTPQISIQEILIIPSRTSSDNQLAEAVKQEEEKVAANSTPPTTPTITPPVTTQKPEPPQAPIVAAVVAQATPELQPSAAVAPPTAPVQVTPERPRTLNPASAAGQILAGMDKDGDGRVSLAEFGGAVRNIGTGNLLGRLDGNGDGKVTGSEMQAALTEAGKLGLQTAGSLAREVQNFRDTLKMAGVTFDRGNATVPETGGSNLQAHNKAPAKTILGA